MVKVTPFEYAQFASLVYDDLDSPKKLTSAEIPEGWEVLNLYKYDKHSAISGYFGMAFKKSDHIVIAHRGTSVIKISSESKVEVREIIDVIDDYISDLQLWLTKKPQQFIAAQTYTKQVILEYPECTISFTGHSLGGVLAQLTAAYYQKRSVVFDSPGAKEIIQKVIKSNPQEIVIFNSHPNVINTINTHYSQPFLLKDILICSDKPTIKEFLFLTTKFHSMASILQQFNTSAPLSTYTTKLASWPVNINEAYKFFISYDQNKMLWDQCLLQHWQQSPVLNQKYTKFTEYKKHFVTEKLYSKNSDPLVITAKFIEELELISEDKLDPANSLLLKFFTEENQDIFTLKSVKKSLKYFFMDKLIAFGKKFLQEEIGSIYDKFTGEHEDESSEKIPGANPEEEYNIF